MEYLLHIATLIAIYSILGVTLNLLAGYTGLVSLAHASFFGTGAYTTAVLATRYNLPILVSITVGIGVAMLVSLMMGLMLGKIKDEYYALATFGLNTIMFSIFLGAGGLTNGPLGLGGIPAPTVFGLTLNSSGGFLVLAVVLAALVYAIAHWVGSSPFGRILRAIRDDELAAQVLGYNTRAATVLIFVLASGLAAIAGGLFASYVGYIEPASFDIIESIFILSIVIFGGLASLPGSLLGAAVLVTLPELLRFVGFPSETAGHMRVLIFGLALVAILLVRPQGLIGRYRL